MAEHRKGVTRLALSHSGSFYPHYTSRGSTAPPQVAHMAEHRKGVTRLALSRSGSFYPHYTSRGSTAPPQVAHMAEHRKGVTRLALSHSGSFFVSGSNDETVKVWDLKRLERDVSFHSRLTYAAQVRTLNRLAPAQPTLPEPPPPPSSQEGPPSP